MAEATVILNPPNSTSPPPNCAICLGSFTNKCFSDSCMHQFCFKCLLEWSKIKAECPLCKQPFRRIIHNVKSNEEYDEHVVEITPPEEIHIIDNEEYLFLPLGGTPQPSTRHHFHFRTTFTVDTRGEHAIQQMLLSHPLTNGGQISVGGYAPSRNMYHRRRRDNTSTSFRRSIYSRNLWVSAPPDVTGRYRDVSPSFFRDCPGARTRLVPWLNRELNALLYEDTRLVMHLVDIIMDHLLQHHICSRTFRNLLYEYLDSKTDHFIHEFYNFMRSPYDMIGYDRHVIYSERPCSPPPYVLLPDDEVSDNDSDVIIVGTSNPQEPVIIDLVNTDSDEPILVSHEEPPRPIPTTAPSNATTSSVQTIEDSFPLVGSPPRQGSTNEERMPILPLKLRLKHKRRSRELERMRNKRKRRRRRSRVSSVSDDSTNSSSTENSEDAYKRYKRRKKFRKVIKKRHHRRFSSERELSVDSSSSNSDDDLPLTARACLRKKGKKIKLSNSPPLSLNTDTKDNQEKTKNGLLQNCKRDELNKPSCSKYSSGSSRGYTPPPPLKRLQIDSQGNRSVQTNETPSCSRYGCLQCKTSHGDTNSSHLNVTKSDDSSNDDYPLKHLLNKGDKQELVEENSVSSEVKSNTSCASERLRNLMLKKEGGSNMWYSYPCSYKSDSSDF